MKYYVELLRTELRNLWRYRWSAFTAAFVAAVLGWSVLFVTPNVYQAQARVYVNATSALKPLLTGIAVDPDVDEELDYVREVMLSRPALKKVAQQTELDLKATTAKQKEALIASLRKDIDIEDVTVGNKRRSSDKLFTITYDYKNRATALAVVRRLLNNFVENSMGAGRQGDENAAHFLKSQIAATAQELSRDESKLAEFKAAHPGMVAAQNAGNYFQQLNAQRVALQHAQNTLAIGKLKLRALELQLREQVPFVPGSTGKAQGKSTAVFGGNTAQRLQEAEGQLESLQLKYTNAYPGIISLLNTIKQLKAQQKKELEQIKKGNAAAAASSGLSSNPVYQQIELALSQQQVEVAGLEGEVRDHLTQIAQLKKMMTEAPEIEAEYTQLDRGYSVTHAEYDALVERLNRAHVTESASESGSIKFEVIDPPFAELAPVKPRRALLTFAIFAAAVLFGIAFAWVRGQLRSVYENPAKLAADTGLAVMGTVSAMGLMPSTLGSRRQKIRFMIACAVLLAAFVLALYLALKGVCYSSVMG